MSDSKDVVQSYEAKLFWRCSCGYENTSFWYFEGETYNFPCDGCQKVSKVLPPKDSEI